MEIKYKKIEELIPYINNQKLHPEQQVLKISNSIKSFGFIQPLVIDGNNEIVIGHGRYEGAKLLNMTEVPCISVSNLSEAEVKTLRLADNKLNESMWDDDLVQLELMDIEEMGFDFSDIMEFDFDVEEIEDFSEKNQEIDVDGYDDEMELKFKLTFDEYNEAKDKLKEIASTPENALKILLKMEI
jgi:hypothetical protein